jgi:hypothetical protein
MKTYGVMEVKLNTFLTSALDGGEWSLTSQPLYPRNKIPSYPLDRSLGRPQGRSGHDAEEKIIPVSTGNRTPIVQFVA